MSSADVWKSWEGRVVEGKFPLRQLLGVSDHSAVFTTELPGTGQKAALKLIPADAGTADRQLARLHSASRLSHSHLMRIFEAGAYGKTLFYIVMEFAEDDLSQVLPQRPLDRAEVAEMLPPALDALSYLHGRGLVHGHLKPSNVLAVKDQLKLASEHVRATNEPSPERRRRDVYDAPENAAGIVSPASDLWSLGVTLVAAFAQNVSPDGGDSNPKLPENMPEPYRSIARDCLHMDPTQRPSVAAIRERLQLRRQAAPVVAPAPTLSARKAEPETETEAAPKSRTRMYVGAVIVILALLVVFAAFRSREKASQESSSSTANQSTTDQSSTSQSSAGQPSTNQPEQPASPPASSAQPEKPAPASASTAATSRGEVVHQVLPDVSKSARNTIHGTIKVGVRVQVDATGKVSSAKLQNPGPSQYFARKAVEAAQQWQFSPPQADGQPAPSAWLLQFRFRRGGTQAVPQRVSH